MNDVSGNKTCQRCSSTRVASGGGKCSDMFQSSMGDREKHGYVADDMGVGGDYIEFTWCLECGQLQGEWPLPPCELEGPGPITAEQP